MNLQIKALEITKDILTKQMAVKDEPQILVYDRQSPLAELLADAYIANMPNAKHLNFDEHDPKEIQTRLMALPKGATVILVQSKNFRLDDFRIRLNLFQQGVGCLEHTHLYYMYEHQFDTYLEALRYRGDYYKALAKWIKDKLDVCKEFRVVSKNGSILTFGPMEDTKVNHGIFCEQVNRGGGAMTGEVFSEAKDFSTVNGEMSIYCYPGEDLRIVKCEPFTLKIKNSFITCDDPKCPEDFKKNILERITENENMSGVFMREAGFGLNPAISKEKDLADVNAFERIAGFHVSLGMKHQIYRQKFDKDIIQRYHIDIFVDTDRMEIDGEVIFENEAYVFKF